MKKVILFLALLWHFSTYFFVHYKVEPFQYVSYLSFWWSYILILDTIVAIKKGSFSVFTKLLPSIIIFSSSFWCIFELINLRTENWFYVAISDETPFGLFGYLLSYGTVLPGIALTKEIVLPIFVDKRTKPIFIKNYTFLSILIGLISLLLLLMFPLYFFPLTWIFLFLIVDGICYRNGYPSFTKELEQGKIGNLIAVCVSGIICGLLWEAWNSMSISRWIYSVPFFEGKKIFEMPFWGYFGFIPFALETVSFLNLLEGSNMLKVNKIAVLFFCLLFSLSCFLLIERYTVFSRLPQIAELSFIEGKKLKSLIESGIRSSYAIDVSLLTEEEREKLALVNLKGMGYERYRLLEKHGIDSVEKLSRVSEETLKQIWNEDNVRRIRVFLRAARDMEEKKWQRKRS